MFEDSGTVAVCTYVCTYVCASSFYICAVLFFFADAEKEREEEKERERETKAEVFSSSIFQRAVSVQQSAPPILKGDDWAIGEVEEDGEEGEYSGLVWCAI